MRATVITDASFCPDTKACGWAAWIAPDLGERHRASGRFKDIAGDVNVAEVRAAINGITLAYRIGARIILIQSDSVAVASAIKKGKWGWAEARTLHFPDATVNYRHVKGHTNIQDARSFVNRWCDKEAKRHMKEMRRDFQLPQL